MITRSAVQKLRETAQRMKPTRPHCPDPFHQRPLDYREIAAVLAPPGVVVTIPRCPTCGSTMNTSGIEIVAIEPEAYNRRNR